LLKRREQAVPFSCESRVQCEPALLSVLGIEKLERIELGDGRGAIHL